MDLYITFILIAFHYIFCFCKFEYAPMCYIDIIGWSVGLVRFAMYGQGMFMLKYSMGKGIGMYFIIIIYYSFLKVNNFSLFNLNTSSRIFLYTSLYFPLLYVRNNNGVLNRLHLCKR